MCVCVFSSFSSGLLVIDISFYLLNYHISLVNCSPVSSAVGAATCWNFSFILQVHIQELSVDLGMILMTDEKIA